MKISKISSFIAGLFAVCAMTAGVSACQKDPEPQPESKGTIQGTVIDNLENPVEGVTVEISDVEGTVTTAADGTFKVENVAIDRHTIKFTKSGYLEASTSVSAAKFVDDNTLRGKQLRNAFAMLMFAQGIPLIYGGDEFGNSQQGNNNVYGQDNELSWIQWNTTKAAKDLLEYVKKLIAFRNEHAAFHMPKEASMADYKSTGIPDLSYHGENAWYGGFEAYRRHLGMMYGAGYAEENTIYVAYNLHQSEHEFGLPILPKGKEWKMIFNTAEEAKNFTPDGVEIPKQRILKLSERSICVLEGK